jgi:hypothetical protein
MLKTDGARQAGRDAFYTALAEPTARPALLAGERRLDAGTFGDHVGPLARRPPGVTTVMRDAAV